MNLAPMNITPEQALHNLYQASRLANGKAEDHEVLKLSEMVLAKMIEDCKSCEKVVCEKKAD